MGDYADDVIDRGMFGDVPFGCARRKTAVRRARANPPRVDPAVDNTDDDHFTWWYEELRGRPGNEKMSEYEVAALAWHEAVARCSARERVQ